MICWPRATFASVRPHVRFALLTLSLLGAAASLAGAQRPDSTTARTPRTPRDTVPRATPPGGRPVAPRDTTARRDSTARDTTARDTLHAAKPLVTWASDSDSVATALINRPGYRATRYQGDTVVFDAQNKKLRIEGEPAAVGREQTIVVGDTILYDDLAEVVTAISDTVILHDPSKQSADIISHGRVTYNISRQRGTLTNVSTSVESGQTYFLKGGQTTFVHDSTAAKRTSYYIRNGMITSCDDSVPDYYFESSQIKFVSKNLLVARPATLYVAGVPVFWLPFLFQDVRSGRRSGILTPRFGLSEFVRNSSSYRRHVENLGYYVNMGDYMDAQASYDWRSSARGTVADPGFSRVNGEFRYHWLDRFISGGIAASHLAQPGGLSNTSVSWNHGQDFSSTSRLTANVNFSTNTQAIRQTTFDPQQQLSTISSDVRYSRKVGPFAMDLGGHREQYSGRTQIQENYPTLSLTSPTLALASWLDWTPSLTFQRNATVNMDESQAVFFRFFTNAAGAPDSSRIKASETTKATRFATPISIHGFRIDLSGSLNSLELDHPVTRTFVSQTDTSQRFDRTFARSATNQADFDVAFSLPGFLPGTLKLNPSVAFHNVYEGAYWVQSDFSGGQWVHQSKRPIFSLSSSPTLFALLPGFGPLTRIRHSITPRISIGYAPPGNVPAAYLTAINHSASGFLGNLPKEELTVGLSQVFEGKLRADTGSSAEGRKVKLLALDFSALAWNFEQARQTHGTGLTTSTFSYTASSDLLPGFSFNTTYSLFQGDVQSDTAVFKPFRNAINASFTLNGQTGIVGAISRLFGHGSSSTAAARTPEQVEQDQLASRLSSLPVTGSNSRERQYAIDDTQGWTSQISFSSTRQRPPIGGHVVQFDPTLVCAPQASNPILFNLCKQQALLNPQTAVSNVNDPIGGGVFVRIPPRETINANSTFHITQKWSASWVTLYDVTNSAFATNQITLQRDLHDWRAIFSFSQAANGASYFSFMIGNKAQPDLKFNYDKPTFRQQDQ
jgi:lipopolysaccharide assembly outer membrane protein LptD (OstA)